MWRKNSVTIIFEKDMMKRLLLVMMVLVGTCAWAQEAPMPREIAMAKDLTMTVDRWGRNYYDYTHLMCCQFECKDGYYFDFYLKVQEDAVQYNHTYTLPEMDSKATYGRRGSTAIVYKTAQLTFTLDELGREVADFFVEDVSGNKYTASWRYKPLPEMQDTIEVLIKDADFTDERDMAYHNYFTFQGRVDSLEFVFCVKSPQLVGDIAEKDVYIGTYSAYTYILVYRPNGSWREISVGRAVNGKVEAGVHEGDYVCTVDLMCYDGHCYRVTFRHEQPESKREEDVHITNMIFNEEFWQHFGVYSYVGSTDDYRAEIILYSPATPGKTYAVGTEVGTVWLHDSRTDEDVPCYSYSDVVVSGTTESPIIKADLLAKDSTLYHITLEFKLPDPSRTVPLEAQGRFADMTADQGCYQIMAYDKDSTYIVSLMINSTSFSGSFTEKNLNSKYTYILEDYVENTLQGSAYKLVSAAIQTTYDAASKSMVVTGNLLCENGNKPSDHPLFELNISCTLDEGLDYDCDNQDVNAKFDADQMTIDKSFDNLHRMTAFYIVGQNDNNQMVGMVFFVKALMASQLPAGTYPVNATMTAPSLLASSGIGDDGSVSFSFISTLTDAGGLATPIWFFRGGSAEVSYVDGKMRIVVDAVNSYDRKIHIEMGAGVVRDLSQLKAEDWTQTPTDHNSTLCSMVAKDGTYMMQVDIKATSLEDNVTYQTSDMNMANCYAVHLTTHDTIPFTTAEFIYHLNAVQVETARISGSANDVAYGISARITKPAREETIEVKDAELNNYIMEMGEFQMRGTNEDATRLVSVAVFSDKIVGHFTERDMDAAFTQVIDDPNEGGMAVLHNLEKADVDVWVVEEDSMLYLEGTLLCRNADDSADVVLYHVKMSTFVVITEGIPYDAPADQPYSHVFESEKIKWNTDYIDYNMVYLEVHDEQGDVDDFIYIGFVVPYQDATTVVPVGTYTIDYSGNLMTVMASSGISPTGGDVAASFVAKKNLTSGKIEPPLWFLQTGTVVVESQTDGVHVTIDAVNSTGATVQIEVRPTATDLINANANVNANANKFIEKGRVVIMRNGIKYDLNGMRL